MTPVWHGWGRVLMIVENNGYPRDPRVRKEAQALVAAGYRVSVIAPAIGERRRLYENLDCIHVYRYPAPPDAHGAIGYLIEYAYSMLAIFTITLLVLLRDGFDVIHAANPPDTLVFIAAFYKLVGKRFIYDHHDLAPEMYYARFRGRGNRAIYLILLWCEKLSCRLADQIVTTNETHRSLEIQRHGVDPDRITIVRNGPSLPEVRSGEIDAELRRKSRALIGCAGVVGVQDGVDLLVRSVHHLVYDLHHPDCLCVIVGDGDALPAVKQLAVDLHLQRHVLFTGWVDDTASYLRYLSTVDVCVDPSPSSAYNDCCTTIKLMEYMMVEKPIVAFDLPENRFTAQESALYARPNDELDFAHNIATLLEDPSRRRAMGAFGRRKVETELAWCNSVPKLLEVYARALPEYLGKAVPSIR